MSGSSADDAISSVVNESEYLCRCFSLAEIQSMTNNFNEELLIRIGGFGKVYKGFIDNGATAVAIKRLKAESNQGAEEFWNEVKMLSKLRHTHLVALIGQYRDCQEMILVYEYMARGTLADHLYKTSRNQTEISTFHLTWSEGSTFASVQHKAKISDFGLSKSTTSHSATHVITRVKGTFGYLDPDYFHTRRLTKKSDVYAFGVVLLEVLCGRAPVDERLKEEEISLILWAQQCIKKGKVDRIIDPSLSGQITPQSLKYFVEVAYNCLHNRPKERPTMAEVVGTLDLALVSRHKGRTEGIIGKVFKGIAIMSKGMNHWWRERKEDSSQSGLSKDLFWEPLSDGFTRANHHFSLDEIRAATNDFNERLLIGNDMFKNVYKGCVDGETSIVMINRFSALALRNWKEVRANIEVHSLLENHPHIVSLIGFCNVKPELIGVICIGATRALQHLHENAKQRVIHCDIKPANILLDENWVAKLRGFGLSKLIPNDTTDVPLMVSRISGTYGYMAPEYCMHGDLTTKFDVYSFGMVLLLVLCAKNPCSDPFWLVHQFMTSINTIDQIIDSNLVGKIAPECLMKFVNIALSCLLHQTYQRPSIDNVVRSLQSALLLQEAWEIHFEIGAELPVIDLYCCSVFSIDGYLTIGGLSLFP
ncbi:hypothetical protein TEA_021516 [Camellia sinensis var. sinensis]|uniref:non-specific serine/threonine protein kinase n=1 Tax=Camellia sinensis var. sinensis TaxID=542762 RepID=A0A4S4F039_CAMSN|nr:hypothetical protein TEA_021516 [Camellia sinensis var. sinensis]